MPTMFCQIQCDGKNMMYYTPPRVPGIKAVTRRRLRISSRILPACLAVMQVQHQLKSQDLMLRTCLRMFLMRYTIPTFSSCCFTFHYDSYSSSVQRSNVMHHGGHTLAPSVVVVGTPSSYTILSMNAFLFDRNGIHSRQY